MATKSATARFQPATVIEVRIWDQRVGALALDPATGYYAFEYDARFLESGLEIAPLAMPLFRGPGPYVFLDLAEATFYRLPALLADALPDRFGNALIEAWMSTRGVAAGAITPLDRLAYMSTRGMGALTFRPARGPGRTKSTAVQLASLVEAARKTVQGELHTEDLTQAALTQIIQLGTSAGGARAKAVIAWNQATREIRSGQFDLPAGFDAWLLKFDGVRPAYKDLGPSETYGRIEYAYHLMAREAGIHMTDCQLLEENGRAHFMTRRFDRDAGGQRHHMQTLCAMAHLDYNLIGVHSYNQLFDTIQALRLGRAAMLEALRRMIFNVAAGNRDDHPKNFSFLVRQGSKQWELAPAYDLTFAYDPKSKWVARHLMSVNGKFDAITRSDLQAVADRYGLLAEFARTADRVRAAVDRWRAHAEAAQVSADQVTRVEDELKRLRVVL
jgi:serine/threonine-protein kinase HipA